MLAGNQVQQAIYVATRLGVADLLAQGPQDAGALAQATGAHPGALYRLLRTLAGFGVFAEVRDGRFALAPIGSLLRAGTEGSMRAFALWSGGVRYQVFGDLEYSVRTGRPAFEHVVGTEFYAYLDGDGEAGALFDEMLSWHTAPVAPLVAAYDFAGMGTVVDLGGGRGDLLAAILRAHPSLRGVLVERSRALQAARQVLRAAGVADRCATVCGDIEQAVPRGGDAYVLKSVLHGLDDQAATRLLRTCRRAMAAGTRLLVVEIVMGPGEAPLAGRLMDLLMLIGCRGRERTEAELRALFEAAGFRLVGVRPTGPAYSLVEGVAV